MKQWNRIDRELILASGSPRRSELLGRMGLHFRVVVDGVKDEAVFFETNPYREALQRLARAKAEKVCLANPDALVIGSDTIVVHDGIVLGKPRDRDDAVKMLMSYSGRSHSVLTTVSIECKSLGFHETVTEETIVNFRDLDLWEIEHYLDTAHYQDKAGAYGIQDEAMLFVDSLNGCYTNVVGFPVTSVISLLKSYQKNCSGE